jgi:hypothetical protein
MSLKEFKRVDCDGKDCTTISDEFVNTTDYFISVILERRGWKTISNGGYYCPECAVVVRAKP